MQSAGNGDGDGLLIVQSSRREWLKNCGYRQHGGFGSPLLE